MSSLSKFFFLGIVFFLFGCNKPSSSPETLDPIYADLLKQTEESKKVILEIKALIRDQEKEMTQAVPQTSQAARARKRLYDLKEKLIYAEQDSKFLEMKTASRKKFDRERYLEAWKEKRPWPEPKEYQAFKEAERASRAKTTWSVKDRFSETGFKMHPPPGKKAEETKEKPKSKE